MGTVVPVPAFDPATIATQPRNIRVPLRLVADSRGVGVAPVDEAGGRIIGTLPPMYPEWLGDRGFGAAHGVRFPYVTGEMVNLLEGAAVVTRAKQARAVGVTVPPEAFTFAPRRLAPSPHPADAGPHRRAAA